MNQCSACGLDKSGPFYLLDGAIVCLDCYKLTFKDFKYEAKSDKQKQS